METKKDIVDKAITGRQNATWSYDKTTKVSTVTFPSGDTAEFPLATLIVELNQDQLALLVYGHKQLLASNSAGEVGAVDKIVSMKKDHSDLLDQGIELTETGKIHFVGRVRENATGASENRELTRKVKEALASPVITLESLAVKKVTKGLTPEEERKFQELIKAAAKYQEKPKK